MGNASSAGGRLYCVVALPAEARPLIDAWSLKRCPESTSLPVYKSVDERRWLVISGVGRVAAAMAVGFLAPFVPDRVRRVGNAALEGARQLLLDVRRHDRVQRLVERIEHIELETTEDFFEVFTEACQFKPMQL